MEAAIHVNAPNQLLKDRGPARTVTVFGLFSLKSSILRTMEARPELKFCSMLSPVKKGQHQFRKGVRVHIFGRSTSIFLAMSCFS